MGTFGVIMTDKTFGKTLRAIREAKGLSQHQLAIKYGWLQGKEYGVTPSIIAQLESGHRNPSRDTIALLAKALESTQAEEADLLLSAGLLPKEYAEDPLFREVIIRMRGAKHAASIKRVLDTVKEILEEEDREDSIDETHS